MHTQELVASAQRGNLDAVYGLISTMVDGIGKLTELNAQYIRATLKEASELSQTTVEKPQDWIALHGTLGAPMAEKVQSYTRELLGIVSSTHAELLSVARAEGEARMRRAQTFVEEATRNAPAGSEAAVAAFNSAITAANTLYQTLGNTGQQAVEVARSNFNLVANAASKSARRASAQ
ncbi:TIGR01841 family phasin [Paraburkholderia sp. BR14263]|uniref:TIGR01841 family phasin n=1 Tax=unclassified Paraburkholderia TaxID=2615204 RepID=UPI0034D00F27